VVALNGTPTLLERAVLQTVRVYGSILKVTAPAGGRGAAHAAVQPSKLHGHFISFFNYGQEAVSEYLTKEAVKEVFQVHLVGPEHAMDRLKELTLGYTSMRMDTRRVYNYLTVYRAINGGEGLPELPSPEDLERKLVDLAAALPAMLVGDARLVTDETHVAMDRMASDDVAGVRVQPDDDEAEGSGDADRRDGGAAGDAAAGDAAGPRERAGGGDPGRAAAAEAGAAPEQRPPQPSETGGGNDAAAELFVDHRMISSRYGADNPAFGEDAVARTVHSVVVALAQQSQPAAGAAEGESESEGEGGGEDQGGADEPAARRAQQTLRAVEVARSAMAVNEFEENHKLIVGAFPADFLVAKGIHTVKSLPVKARQNLMRQFHGRFARNQELVFLLANQVQRHAHALAVHLRAKSDPASFEALTRLVGADDFGAILEDMANAPHEKLAQDVVREIEPHLVACSASVPFSAMARNRDVTSMYSLWRGFGLPSAFCTVSPDDVHNPLAVRLTVRTVRPDKFPESDDGFAACMLAGGDEVFQGVVSVKDPALRRYMADNPVAAAEAYNRLLTAVWRHLIGIEPIHLGGVGSKKSFLRRTKGLFGLARAACGATEEQFRKALHHHFVIWGDIPPEVLHAHFEAFMPALAEVLESMFQAEVRPSVHIADIARRALHAPMKRHHDDLNPGEDGYDALAETIAVRYNTHGHTFTCKCVARLPARSAAKRGSRLPAAARPEGKRFRV